MGGTTTRPGLPGCQKLLGDGSESDFADGATRCYCGLAGGVEGPADTYTWWVKDNREEISKLWTNKMTGEYLEWIVIVLIAAEILVAAINIVVDLYAGGD